ncbi:Retrovirus-related Pol polyprotein from type-1 retrotransposable element R2 [Eumeta japonica]|uniref:Retrovirus-related Pol polyprotein from type-1 retrotransposable element R2 n=1 Tax=Eumeta variegata TaxID=151549 RepID=A0A4C1WRK4_EUMVA|nr:Retrovirus-related Pol polyprotein from type-1 retrotransposable element R2 [Eumeta japonica]
MERKGNIFNIQQEVRKEDPLFPKLFPALLETVFRNLNWENFGLNVQGRKLTHLRFEDDIVLIAKTPEKLNVMINTLASEREKVGLKINPDKAKLMTNGDCLLRAMNFGRNEFY